MCNTHREGTRVPGCRLCPPCDLGPTSWPLALSTHPCTPCEPREPGRGKSLLWCSPKSCLHHLEAHWELYSPADGSTHTIHCRFALEYLRLPGGRNHRNNGGRRLGAVVAPLPKPSRAVPHKGRARSPSSAARTAPHHLSAEPSGTAATISRCPRATPRGRYGYRNGRRAPTPRNAAVTARMPCLRAQLQKQTMCKNGVLSKSVPYLLSHSPCKVLTAHAGEHERAGGN